jgi:hypothetical protein
MDKQMSETAEHDVDCAGDSSASEGTYNTGVNDIKSIASTKGNNVLKNLKEDSETFCAIKAFLVILFLITCVGVAISAYVVTSDQEQDDFEAKVGVLLLYIVGKLDWHTNAYFVFRFSSLCLLQKLPIVL